MISPTTRRPQLLPLLTLVSLFAVSCIPQPEPHELATRQQNYEELLRKVVLTLRTKNAASLGQAESLLKLADELVPHTARVADGYGCLELRRGRVKNARAYFLEARRRDPSYARAYAHLAYVDQRRGELDQAESWYQAALTLKPLDTRTRWNYASFLYTHRSVKRGELEFQKVLSLLSPQELELLKAKPLVPEAL